MSFAYAMSVMLGAGISGVYMLKSVGDKTLPCGMLDVACLVEKSCFVVMGVLVPVFYVISYEPMYRERNESVMQFMR